MCDGEINTFIFMSFVLLTFSCIFHVCHIFQLLNMETDFYEVLYGRSWLKLQSICLIDLPKYTQMESVLAINVEPLQNWCYNFCICIHFVTCRVTKKVLKPWRRLLEALCHRKYCPFFSVTSNCMYHKYHEGKVRHITWVLQRDLP